MVLRRWFLLVLALGAAPLFVGSLGCSKPAKPASSADAASAPSGEPVSLYNEAPPDTASQPIDGLAAAAAAQLRITTVLGQALRVGVAIWMVSHEGCPTADDIVAAHLVSESLRATDAWDHPFRITCAPRGAIVTSAGPDGKMGTPDDITVGQ